MSQKVSLSFAFLMSMVSLSAIGALIMITSLFLFCVSIQKPVNVSITYNVATPEPKGQASTKTKTVSVKKPVVDKDTYQLAQIINAEARGESYLGKLAVGNVVLNRLKDSQFPDTIESVIFQRGQFSPVMDGSIYNKPSKEALNAAKELLNGRRVLENDVLFFYNPKTSTSSWIFTRPTVGQIGNHMFAR